MCLCVHILILGRDTISTESLDPKECVDRFGGALRKFEYIFSRRTFCAPKNGQNRLFMKILKSILCACGCTYLFWDASRSEQVPLPPKYLWKETWVLNSNSNPFTVFGNLVGPPPAKSFYKNLSDKLFSLPEILLGKIEPCPTFSKWLCRGTPTKLPKTVNYSWRKSITSWILWVSVSFFDANQWC